MNIKELNNLRELRLYEAQVTGAGIVHLKEMTNLQTLSLSGTKVTAAGFADLQQALPNCKIRK